MLRYNKRGGDHNNYKGRRGRRRTADFTSGKTGSVKGKGDNHLLKAPVGQAGGRRGGNTEYQGGNKKGEKGGGFSSSSRKRGKRKRERSKGFTIIPPLQEGKERSAGGGRKDPSL